MQLDIRVNSGFREVDRACSLQRLLYKLPMSGTLAVLEPGEQKDLDQKAREGTVLRQHRQLTSVLRSDYIVKK